LSADIFIRHVQGAFTLEARFGFHAPGVTALFGPSGSGKSTIIHAIAGLIRPDEGEIAIDGNTLLDTSRKLFVPAHARRMGVVFQDSRLFPHLSVASNLRYGARRAKVKEGAADFDAIVKLLGLAHLLARRPRTLSGGERSRVALGRALLMNPRALLLDEPMAALDAVRKAEILPYLERVRDEAKIPILYVSHSMDEVARLADRIIVLDDGKVVAEGSLFDVTSNLDLLSGRAALPGSVLEATVSAHDEAHDLTELAVAGEKLIVPYVPHRPGEKIRIRIDAEDVMLALQRPEGISANNIFATCVAGLRAGTGPYEDVLLDFGGARLVARITRRSAERLKLAPGQSVFAVIKSVTVGGRK
jgi:molybdate transport system ATP-binding protein